jgi:Peptidase family M23
MRRLLVLLPVLIAFQAGAPPALAWTWPADGPVLRPFTLGDDPYAGGQHRGVDIAGAAGTPVRAPAAGVVSFASTVPGGGRTVTVRTSDGYSVTLVHLGSVAVERDELLPEGATVGAIGPTGDVEHLEAYVHLGIRLTSDPHGYLDPLLFLPAREAIPAPAPPAPPEPAPAVPPVSAPPSPAPPREAPAPAPAPEAPGTPTGEEPARMPVLAPLAAGKALPAAVAMPPAGVERPTSRRPARTVPPGRLLLRSFELPSVARRPAQVRPGPQRAQPVASAAGSLRRTAALAAVTALGAAVAAGALRVRGRQLGDARLADAAAPVLDQRSRRAAEDARAAGSAQEDGLVLDRDLESIALQEIEPLPDLDRDDDPAELVQVADDPCRRSRGSTAPLRFHQVRPRSSSRCTEAEKILVR